MNLLSKLILGGMTCLVLVLPANAQDADLVLRNGIVWTVDDDNPRGEAIASLNDKIVYVGSDAGVEQYIGPDTRVVDLGGKLVTPGFNDNHVHFESTGRLLYGLSLLDISDQAGFVGRIRDVHERYAPGPGSSAATGRRMRPGPLVILARQGGKSIRMTFTATCSCQTRG